jgi:hypothetical protein
MELACGGTEQFSATIRMTNVRNSRFGLDPIHVEPQTRQTISGAKPQNSEATEKKPQSGERIALAAAAATSVKETSAGNSNV